MAESRSDLSTCVEDIESAYSDFVDGANFIMSGITISNIESAFTSFYNGVNDIEGAIYACENEIDDFNKIIEELETIKDIFTEPWEIAIEAV